MDKLRQLFDQHIAFTAPEPIGIEVSYAKGIYLYGPNGKKWIDFISGICVMNLGHGVPEVIDAIREQAERYLHTMVYGESIMAPQVLYAKALSQALGEGFEKVYFLNGGTEANEASLKAAKRFTGRKKIVACINSYHGSTHGSLSVSGNPKMKENYGPLLPEVYHIPYNDRIALEEIDQDTACIILEAIQGAGGGILADDGYLKAVRQRCDETGALMILDEIQTGFGRTGSMFAHQAYGVKPDILTLAKALGAGLPLGAWITRKEIANAITHNPILGHINTFGGGPLSAAAGLAAFKKLESGNLLEGVSNLENILIEQLQHPSITELRGKGLLYAVLFEDYEKSEQVRKTALDKGLLTIGFLNIKNGLRISPPLNITVEELRTSIEILKASM
ncbi:MAG: aspartate aminotransferase family protein [Bacteroidia bacterium]|nr:aspartate aminotransferase family protein [Bacteroidia bacterium]